MAEDVPTIEWGHKPSKAGGGRKLKWLPTLKQIVDEPQLDDDGNPLDALVATRGTSSAASGIAQTIRKTAAAESLKVDVSTRRSEDSDEYGVWVTPSVNGAASKPKAKAAPKKAAPKKAPAKSTSKGGRRRRTTSAKS